MAKIILTVENRTHDWDDADPRLQDDNALREFFGDISHSNQYRTAEIVRRHNGDTLEITITPRMGQKGSGVVLQALLDAPEEIHPALLLAWRLAGYQHGSMPEIAERLERYHETEGLIERAEEHREVYRSQVSLLQEAQAVPAREVPLGF